MKFFFLAHGGMSLICLKGLLEKGYKPQFMIAHRELDYNKLKDAFYDPLEELCIKENIPLYRVNKITEAKDEISKCEIGICLGFMEIIKREIFELPKYGIMNLHCGKLPKYRGRAPISRSIINGEESVTVSLHKMDKGVDSGDVCQEINIPIGKSDDINTMYEKCSQKTPQVIEQFFIKMQSGTLHYRKQDLTNYPKANRVINEEERKINWKNDSSAVYNLIRALVLPYPCAYFRFGGKSYAVLKAEKLTDGNMGKPGEIIKVTGNGMDVICGEGAVRILELADGESNRVNLAEIFHKGDILE